MTSPLSAVMKKLTGPANDVVHQLDLAAPNNANGSIKAKKIVIATGSSARSLFGL